MISLLVSLAMSRVRAMVPHSLTQKTIRQYHKTTFEGPFLENLTCTSCNKIEDNNNMILFCTLTTHLASVGKSLHHHDDDVRRFSSPHTRRNIMANTGAVSRTGWPKSILLNHLVTIQREPANGRRFRHVRMRFWIA